MKSLPTMRVGAVEGRMLPAIDAQGAPLLGRYVARTRKGDAIPEGVVVVRDSYHQRAVDRGDLVLVTEPPPAATPPAEVSSEVPPAHADGTNDAPADAPADVTPEAQE